MCARALVLVAIFPPIFGSRLGARVEGSEAETGQGIAPGTQGRARFIRVARGNAVEERRRTLATAEEAAACDYPLGKPHGTLIQNTAADGKQKRRQGHPAHGLYLKLGPIPSGVRRSSAVAAGRQSKCV